MTFDLLMAVWVCLVCGKQVYPVSGEVESCVVVLVVVLNNTFRPGFVESEFRVFGLSMVVEAWQVAEFPSFCNTIEVTLGKTEYDELARLCALKL